MDAYVDNKDFAPLPVAGRYTVRAPESFPAAAFGRTKTGGNLSIAVDPTIIGPTSEGYTLRFTKVSAKQYKRAGVTVSQLGDYLRATGFKGRLADEQAQADAVEQTANQMYQIDADWRVYNKNTGFSLEGMERFPKLPDGSHQPWIEDPADKDDTGAPVRLRANLFVARFVPQS